MKKHLIALMSAATALISAQVQADQLSLDGAYISVFGGGNFISRDHHHDVKTSFDAGYVVGTAVGYNVADDIRAEGEFAYRNNHLDRISIRDHKGVKHPHAYVSTYSLMANGYYDIDCGLEFTPYVGAGIGYGWNEGHHHRGIHCVGKKRGFAYQAMVGASTSLYCNLKAKAEYRFYKDRAKLDNHAAIVALEYAL